MALGQLGAVGPVDQRDVGEARLVPAHGLENLHLSERVGQMVVAADDMGDPHVVVVHHHRMQIGRRAVAAQDDHVVHLGVGDANGTLHEVFHHRFTLARGFQANGGCDAGRRLRRVAIAPAAVVAGGAAFLGGQFPHLLQFVGGAVAVIGFTGRQQFARHIGMPRRAGGLENGLLIAIEAEPIEAFEDDSRGFVGGPLAVGILDAQQEGAAFVAGVQKVEQRGAGAADMQQAGGAGGEAGADCHGG